MERQEARRWRKACQEQGFRRRRWSRKIEVAGNGKKKGLAAEVISKSWTYIWLRYIEITLVANVVSVRLP